jgi:site-specific recombinase XerD
MEVYMSVKVREKRRKLYLDIYQGGKRTLEALNLALTTDKAQNKEIWRYAEICRSKRETQLLTGAWNIQDAVSGKKKLVTYLEEYSKSYTNPGIVKSLIYHIKKFNSGETIQISQITPKWVDDFQNYLLGKVNKEELSQTSAANYAKILRAGLKKAAANNIINQNPATTVQRIQEQEADLVFLNIEELQHMASVQINDPYGAEIRRAFLFSCYTGLRISDLETITWSRIETNPTQIIKNQKKTKNPVYIPLGNSARKLIIDGAEHNQSDRIFNLAGHNRRSSYKYLKKWADEAKVRKNIAWHTARRTFATMALENGVDIYTVAKLLGHTNINQVAKYAKVTDKLRREAIAALPEIKL